MLASPLDKVRDPAGDLPDSAPMTPDDLLELFERTAEAVRVAVNIRMLSIATLIGDAIGRTAAEESVSSLFD